MEQPREPIFYPNDTGNLINVAGGEEKTLQSIERTLKRIEAILLEAQSKKNRFDVSDEKHLF